MAQFGRGVAGFAFDSNGEWAVTLAAATLRDGMGPSGKTGGVVPTLGHELSHVVTGTEHPELIGMATAVPLTSNLWWDRYPPNVYVNSLSEVVGYSVGALLGHNPLLLELPEYR
jgi:hypothetical protein